MKTRHACAYAPDGTRYLVPPIALCTGRERAAGSTLAMGDEYVTCKRCLAKLAAIPAPRTPERTAWMAANGVRLR